MSPSTHADRTNESAGAPSPALTIDLPLIINGRTRLPADVPADEVRSFRYENGVIVRIPALRDDDVDRIAEEAATIDADLAALSLPDIITFMGEVGERWDQRQLYGRRLVRSYAHRITQFSDVMMERDYETIGHFMAQRWHSYDEIESQFGDQRIFDEWRPVQMSLRRAFPRGLVLHYLVGNLPLASMYSMVRGILTKNRTLAKLPTRDPLSPVALALAFLEVDANHPVSRSLSLAYWPHDDEVGDRCFGLADAACVWGGADAVQAVKAKLPVNVPLAEFGPKWSASVVDLTEGDAAEGAMRVVQDACFYDQEACFNSRRVYVRGNVEPFVHALVRSFEEFRSNLPFVSENRDNAAHRSMLLLEAQFLGYGVWSGADWAIVVQPADAPKLPHPLGRTIFLHPIDDPGTIGDQFDRDTQTLGVFPWSLTERYRDVWANAGVDRMVDLGFSRMPRAGFTHDAMLGMHQFVRLVSIERPWSDSGRYYTRRPDAPKYFMENVYGKIRALMRNDELFPKNDAPGWAGREAGEVAR